MTSVSGAPACPFVAFDDARDDRSDRPDPRHRCYAENPPAPRARAHQEAYCLSANFPVCPTFQDWARRESARVLPVAASSSAADRLRDVPAQRAAGERPPGYERPATSEPGPAAGAAAAAGAATSGLDPGMSAWSRPPSAADDGRDAAPGGPSDGMPVAEVDPDAARQPWDLPPRKPVAPDWTAPPPWVAGGPAAGGSTAPLAPNGPGSTASSAPPAAPPATAGISRPPLPPDVEPPEFLRSPAGAAAVDATFDTGFEDESDLPEADEAMSAPLASAGMAGRASGPGAGSLDPRALEEPFDPSATARPVGGTTRDVGAPAAAVATGASIGAPAGRPASSSPADFDDDVPAAPNQPASPSKGLGRVFGWDRRPKAGSGRQPKVEPQPSWERPRRYEAYPTLKTRVGFGAPSRLLLYAAALLVAAVVLFFVPPLLLRSGGGGETPGSSASADPSGAAGGSARPSAGRTAAPTAKQVTYTVRQGDTLSTIARRFHVTMEQLLAANKNIKNPNKIAVGDVIIIPTPAPSVITDGGPSPT